MSKRKNRYHKARHAIWYHIMRAIMRVYCWKNYRFRTKKFNNRKRPYLFLYNHPTPVDALHVCLAAPKLTYLVCTEDLYAMGSTTKFFKHAVAPIPFKKSMIDPGAVMTCARVAREGYSIALSPSGNRTFTGESCRIKPAVAKLVKMLKLPVAIYMVSGGYERIPRYADKPRKKVKVRGEVTKVLELEEYKDMSADELYKWIVDAMHYDESDTGHPVKSKYLAESMERAAYRCCKCGTVGKMQGKGNTFSCRACGASATVDGYRHFIGDFPVKTMKEWIDGQNEWVHSIDITKNEEPIAVDEGVLFRKLNLEKACKEVLCKSATVKLFTDRFEIDGKVYAFDDIAAVAPCGRNRVDFYFNDITYQMTRETPFSILMYTNIYYHYKDTKEDGDGFLGI